MSVQHEKKYRRIRGLKMIENIHFSNLLATKGMSLHLCMHFWNPLG